MKFWKNVNWKITKNRFLLNRLNILCQIITNNKCDEKEK